MTELMLFPSGGCNASCGYCFSAPGEARGLMPFEVFERAIGLYARRVERDGAEARIVFHGGEPLLAGIGFYRKALGALRETFGGGARIGIQSNLWLLDEAYCGLFRDYGVHVGTSLDGPRRLNDEQRCEGYFDRTMKGIELLRREGLPFGCIATMAKPALARPGELMEFFVREGLDFNVHAALRPSGAGAEDGPFLNEGEASEALSSLFDEYAPRLGSVKIRLFDEMIRNVGTRHPSLCAFSRCLGDYLAVAPDGELYPCNRFVGDRAYSLGNVMSIEDLDEMELSPGWKRLQAWFERVDEECGDCAFKDICNGGCPYSGISRGGDSARDANCDAYRKIYSTILDRTALAALDEITGPEEGRARGGAGDESTSANAAAAAGLLRIQRGQAHPRDLRRYAGTIVAAAALGRTHDERRIADLFAARGLSTDPVRSESAVSRLRDSMFSPASSLATCYLHVTDGCGQSCPFCYMGDRGAETTELPADRALAIIREAGELGFGKIVITGGEPTTHGEFLDFARELARSDRAAPAPFISLRTNLTRKLGDEEADLMAAAFDEIVVSLDGDRKLHDSRRGRGSYDGIMANLELFARGGSCSKLSIATLFDYSSLSGEELDAQREHVLGVKERFRLRRVKFLPTKPLGRAAGIAECPAAPGAEQSLDEALERGYRPKASCGLGSNLMILPDGGAYPCYALAGEDRRLGDAIGSGLAPIVRSPAFRDLKLRTIDSDPVCGACSLRYLCERKCLCWKGECHPGFKKRAESLLGEACAVLGLETEALEELR